MHTNFSARDDGGGVAALCICMQCNRARAGNVLDCRFVAGCAAAAVGDDTLIETSSSAHLPTWTGHPPGGAVALRGPAVALPAPSAPRGAPPWPRTRRVPLAANKAVIWH